MTEKYLKPYQYYADQYDRFTVEEFRRLEKVWEPDYSKREGVDETFESVRPPMEKMVSDVAFVFKKGNRYKEKKNTIKEWMKRDEEYDRIYEESQPISNIQCLTCRKLMFVSTKTLDDTDSKKPTRVLFTYDCPLGHFPRRAFFSDGEEYKHEPNICVKCKNSVDEKTERNEKLIKIIDTCKHCGHVEVIEFDLSPKVEVPDPDFAKDRERFCLSEEEGERYISESISFEYNSKFIEEMREKDKNKDLYEKAAKLRKLTIIELEKLLAPELEKAEFVKLSFKEPEIEKDVVIPFVVYESKSDCKEKVSCSNLEKLIKKALEGTNWKLMTMGVTYRLGMLEGRLRGYEREEDLLKLVK